MKSPLTLPALLVASLLLGACGSAPSSSTSADRTPPRVTLDALPGTVRPGKVQVQATASDDVAVREVRFYLNDQLVDTDRTEPYQTTYDLSQSGSFVLKAVAVDTSGNESAPATQTVKVEEAADTERPTISLSGPARVSTSAPIEFVAAATDNVGVVRVEFYDGAQRLAEDTQAPYILTRSMTSADNGIHTIRAMAYDAAGNSAEASQTVTVTLSATQPADNIKPTLKLDVPGTITTPGDYTLAFSASDNVGVVKLDVQLVAQTALGKQVFPYTLNQSSGTLPLSVTRELNGTYTLSVIAYDAAGNSVHQQAVITVAIP